MQRTSAAHRTYVHEWQTGHSPFAGRPHLIVELVQELLATLMPPREK